MAAEEEEIIAVTKKGKPLAYFMRELRMMTSWMLGFYSFFFLIAAFAITKGFGIQLPFLASLFDTPFLIFFAVFLFLLSLTLSVWHHYLRRRRILFTLTSLTSAGLFLLFVINF